jgi:RNA recognition motif-containing protein
MDQERMMMQQQQQQQPQPHPQSQQYPPQQLPREQQQQQAQPRMTHQQQPHPNQIYRSQSQHSHPGAPPSRQASYDAAGAYPVTYFPYGSPGVAVETQPSTPRSSQGSISNVHSPASSMGGSSAPTEWSGYYPAYSAAPVSNLHLNKATLAAERRSFSQHGYAPYFPPSSPAPTYAIVAPPHMQQQPYAQHGQAPQAYAAAGAPATHAWAPAYYVAQPGPPPPAGALMQAAPSGQQMPARGGFSGPGRGAPAPRGHQQYGPHMPTARPAPAIPGGVSGMAQRSRPDLGRSQPSASRSRTASSGGNSATGAPAPLNNPLPPRPPAAPQGEGSATTQQTVPSGSVAAVPGSPHSSQSHPRGVYRPLYHPQQGPRSEHVLWVGNVPSDATVEELWNVFAQLPPDDAEPEHAKAGAAAEEGPDDAGGDTGSVSARTDDESDHGVLSIFVISRSNCAFVNYASPRHLERAVKFFHDKPVRPEDTRCPKMVCRVRKKEDESQAGVQGQRGRGIHVALVKEHERKRREAARAQKADSGGSSGSAGHTTRQPSDARSKGSVSSQSPRRSGSDETARASPSTPSVEPAAPKPVASPASMLSPSLSPTATTGSSGDRPPLAHDSSGSISIASTSSSLLRHPVFRERFFILKSLRAEDLDRSVQTGLWATQPHNEAVLDQAYRNSETVFLVFSANQSGCFYGYARMTSLIRTQTTPSSSTQAKRDSNGSNGSNGTPKSPKSIVQSPSPAQSPSSPAGYSSQKRPSVTVTKPSTIDEGDESSSTSTRSTSRSLTPEQALEHLAKHGATTSYMLSPAERDRDPMASPQPMTPLDEDRQFPSATTSPDDREVFAATWPPSERQRQEADQEQQHRNTLSPRLLRAATAAEMGAPPGTPTRSNSSLSSRSSLAPIVSGASEISDQELASARPPSPSSSPRRPSVAHADADGIKRLDMAHPVGTPTGVVMSASLGPNDSVSVSHAQRADQISLRAVIHNLRLEERESQRKAAELEAHLNGLSVVSGDGSSGVYEPSRKPSSEPRTQGSGETDNTTASVDTPRAASSDSWGQPFRIEWLETRPLPFQNVRRLRNPWRDNRQVKVSRDGTELEPSVGRQLLEEWSKIGTDEANAAARAPRQNSDDTDDGEEDAPPPRRRGSRQSGGARS